MKYTLTKRDIGILLGFFGIVALGLTYYFIYRGYTAKTTELNAANTAMQARVDVLQDLVNRQQELVDNTEKYNREADDLMGKFPADYKYEDAILYGIELIETSPLEKMPNISFGEDQVLYTFTDIDAAANEQVRGYIPDGAVTAPVEGEEQPEGSGEEEQASAGAAALLPELRCKTIVYTNMTDYSGFKNALASVVNKNERSGLNVSAVYDETEGLIVNNLSVSSYFVTNTDKVYTEPEMPMVIKGTEDIFGTVPMGSHPVPGRLNMGSSSVVQNNNTSE